MLTQDLVDHYQLHSLREGFRSLDTTLQVPYREPGNGNLPTGLVNSTTGECVSHV